MESCDRRIANSTTIMSATRISIDNDADQGRSTGFRPASERTALATQARWSLNRAVNHGSCSGIYKVDQNFQNDVRRGGEQSYQSGAQTQFGKIKYSIRRSSQNQIAKRQEHVQTGA